MHIPLATYRLQFNPNFTFKTAVDTVSYLSELGVSDLYASPIFKAKKDSMHGYDVVDPNQLNPQLGSRELFERLTQEVKKHEMSWLQDIVPNHMAYDSENDLLMDVLENGPHSRYINFFDIEWNHPYASIRGRILAPFLGEFYGESLESGKIKLAYDQDGLSVRYYDSRYPLKIESYQKVFENNIGRLRKTLGREHPDFVKLLGIFFVLNNLPINHDRTERYGQINFVKRLFWELYTQNVVIKKLIDESIEHFNGQEGVPESYNQLDQLLSEQFFRLSFWKVGTEELNYRRFFNINDLITLRMEDEEVFRNTHTLVLRMVAGKEFNGLRIDHVDGLFDPTQYLARLRKAGPEAYIVVEKILDLNEELPGFWPIQGTTGYDFLNYVNGLFCKKENEPHFDKIYRKFSNVETSFKDLIDEKKRLIIGKLMASDVDNLAHLISRISSHYRYGNDFTLYGLKRALVEALTYFPVYRSYISPERLSESDRTYIGEAIRRAREEVPELVHELDFLEKVLLLHFDEHVGEEERNQWLQFVMRFQQFTGPLMAKGFEDTLFYVYNRLVSLNEVGGKPGKFGISHIEFHHFNKKRASQWPHTMNTTSTHDTKRGEDVRARLNVLSEMPDEWQRHLRLWSKINRRKRRRVRGLFIPDNNDEYFLYQTLLGSWPFEKSEYSDYERRIKHYIIKAIREAKIHTAWLKPDTDYEEIYLGFLSEILKSYDQNAFLKDFLPFQRKIASYGIFNSLAQTAIKMTAPGVPDFYQGTEFWDLSLVDPDNRRPVDYDKRRAALKYIRKKADKNIPGLITELLQTVENGRIKLFLIYRTLSARRSHPDIFQNGDYLPLEIGGVFRDHVIAFARNYQGYFAVTVAPRFLSTLVAEGEQPLGEAIWQDTYVLIPENIAVWDNVITSEQIRGQDKFMIGDILKHFPVAVLIGNPNQP